MLTGETLNALRKSKSHRFGLCILKNVHNTTGNKIDKTLKTLSKEKNYSKTKNLMNLFSHFHTEKSNNSKTA